MQLVSTTAEVPTSHHSVEPSRMSGNPLSAALQQLSQLSGQRFSTPTQHQVQSIAPGPQEASVVLSAAAPAHHADPVGLNPGATSAQHPAHQAVVQESTAPAAPSSCPLGPADRQTDGTRLTNPTDSPLHHMQQQLGSTQQQQDQQQQAPRRYSHLQGLLPPVPHAHMLSSPYGDELVQAHYELHAQAYRGPEAYAQEQMLSTLIHQFSSPQGQAVLQQLLGPAAQQQQQQQGSALPASQPLPAALLQQQREEEEGKTPAAQLPVDNLAAAAAGSACDVPAGGSNGCGKKSSTLQQLLAMALDETQPRSGVSDALLPPDHLSQNQQHQHGGPGGGHAEVPDSMLLQPQAPYTAGRRARAAQQQQQQQQGPAGAESDAQRQQQQKVVKKRRARVMTPSGMGMCQDITPGSIKAVPVALRLTKGSSGEYRLRMPTALILSQFAFAKMPVTLPLEVFVDGKPVATPLAPPRKRQRTALNDPSGARCDRPLVKIVCDCDRYRLSGLASAGLGRYVGYTVTRVASHDGASITLFLESPREDRFAGLDMAGYGDSLPLAAAAAAAAAATAAAPSGQQLPAPGSDVAHRDVFATLTAAAALTATVAGGADINALASARESVGGASQARPDCEVAGGPGSQGFSAVGADPGSALLHSLSAQLQEPLQQQQQADLLTLRVFEDMQQQILQYQAFFQQLGVQPPMREDKATQWDPLDLDLPAAAAAGAASTGDDAMGTASAGAAAGCGSSGTAIHQQQGGVDNSPTPVGTDKRAAEGPKTHEATPPAAAATGPERGAHVPAGAAAAAVSHGVPVKLEPHCDKQHQHCSLAASAPAAVPTAAAGASAAVGLASGASCRPQVQAGAPRVVEADEAADALLMLSR